MTDEKREDRDPYDLSGTQWLVLDLLMRAKAKGADRLNRAEILNTTNSEIPIDVRVKLAMAALTMPEDLVIWIGQHEFMLTHKGTQFYLERFGAPKMDAPHARVADKVICLPGPEAYKQ